MSDQSDSQNKSAEQIHMSEGTSPSSSSDEGSRSTPSNLPKAATRTRKKRTSDSEDEDFVIEEEVNSNKKKVLKKEYVVVAAAINPGMQKKAPAKRAPVSKDRASTQETMEFTLELREEEAAGGKKRKERESKRLWSKSLGSPL